ncbi:hypothetical protein LTS06_011813 [Exophiala xenobiotica]|nr:hypothetical protein LTS06_011813 [Exophiala xenobiotica]
MVLVAQGPTEVLGGQDDDPAVTVTVDTAGQVFGTVTVLATHDEPPVGPTGTVIVDGTQVPGVFGGQLPGGNVTVDTIVVGEPAGGQVLPPVGPTGVPQEVTVTGGGRAGQELPPLPGDVMVTVLPPLPGEVTVTVPALGQELPPVGPTGVPQEVIVTGGDGAGQELPPLPGEVMVMVPALGQELPPVGPTGVLAPHDPGVVMVIVEAAAQDVPAPPGVQLPPERVVVMTLVLVTVALLHPVVTPPTFVVPVPVPVPEPPPEPPPVPDVVPYQSVQEEESCRGSTGLAAAKMLQKGDKVT